MELTPPILFDRTRLRKRRARLADGFAQYDFLHRVAAEQTIESIAFINRSFPTVIELGVGTGQLAQRFAKRNGTEHYITCDTTPTLLQQKNGLEVIANEELLPFAANSADAVVSILSLHWVNDLPGTLAQIHRILKPDGMFIAVLPGGETLRELRATFAAVESAQTGGMSPRVAPFIDVRDAGALLQRAGFALPVADSDTLTVTYPNLFALMNELRGAGESNMLRQQLQHFTPKKFFLEAAKYYAEHYSDAEQQIAATMELVTLTGWKPAANQQQPAKRGSGKVSLKAVLQ